MISRRESQGFPPNVTRQVFAADTAKLPAYVGIPIPDAGYMLLRVSKVVDEPAKEADDASGYRKPGDEPALFTALQEQLGLKLNPQRATLDVLVIDSIERWDRSSEGTR